MQQLFYEPLRCPYCGERILLQIDESGGDQAYIEDCSVCCRPIEVDVSHWDGQWHLEVRRDDD